MAQSRVSRHLAILREAGLLADRRDGTFVAYRLAAARRRVPGHDAWALARESLAEDPTCRARRRAAPPEPSRRRQRSTSRSQTSSTRSAAGVGRPAARASATICCAPAPRPSWCRPACEVADIGTGTGILALELAELGLDVIGIDRSEAMLEAARAKVLEGAARDACLGRVEFRIGRRPRPPPRRRLGRRSLRAYGAPLARGPGARRREMARIVRPGRPASSSSTSCPTTIEWMEAGARARSGSASRRGGRARLARTRRPRAQVPVSRTPRHRTRNATCPASFVAAARKPDEAARAMRLAARLLRRDGHLIETAESVGEVYRRMRLRSEGVDLDRPGVSMTPFVASLEAARAAERCTGGDDPERAPAGEFAWWSDSRPPDLYRRDRQHSSASSDFEAFARDELFDRLSHAQTRWRLRPAVRDAALDGC